MNVAIPTDQGFSVRAASHNTPSFSTNSAGTLRHLEPEEVTDLVRCDDDRNARGESGYERVRDELDDRAELEETQEHEDEHRP